MSDAPLPHDPDFVPQSSMPDPRDRQTRLGASSPPTGPTLESEATTATDRTVDSATEAATWQDWQTVSFPQVLNVDQLTPAVSTPAPSVPPAPVKAPTPAPAAAAAVIDDVITDEIDEIIDEVIIEPDWQRQAPTAVPTPAIAPPAAEMATSQPAESGELLTLIHELNECNDALLERVQYLEQVLTATQQQLETARSTGQDHSHQLQQAQEALRLLQTQLVRTTDELEFAQQSVQRQSIRMETLEEQYETSQQRVAELERECALVQQRYQEQTHLWQEEKAIAQDLQSRLQRQQRFTLQYKVALKKCLDVPPPSYQHESDRPAPRFGPPEGWGQSDALPTVPGIQPWSTHHPVATPKFRWTPPTASDTSDVAVPPLDTSDLDDPWRSAPPATPDPIALSPESGEPNPGVTAAPAPAIAMPPLDLDQLALPDLADVPDVAAPARASISYSLKSPSDLAPHRSAPEEELIPSLETPPVAAEDALWEDLARLIDASTEANDGILTPLDDIAFEDSQREQAERLTAESDAVSASVPEPELATEMMADHPQMPPAAVHTPLSPPAAAPPMAANPGSTAPRSNEAWLQAASGPSPVVYPLRTPKRRKSLAAVELPCFPRSPVSS